MVYISRNFTPAGNSTGAMGYHTYVDTADTLANIKGFLDTAEVSDNVRVGDIMALTGSDGSSIHAITAVAAANITLNTGLVLTA